MRQPRLCWEIRQGRKHLSKRDHPSNWGDAYSRYYQKEQFNKVPWKTGPKKKPYDREVDDLQGVARTTIQHVHELEMIKSLLTAIMNTLDEQKELMEDHSEMLDDLMYALYKDEE